MREEKRRELVKAWGKWLGKRKWSWFCTFTFKEKTTFEKAKRIVVSFLKKIKNDSFAFIVIEKSRWRSSPHVHALVGNTKNLLRMEVVKRWNERWGFARVFPFDSSGGATYYLGKKVTSDCVFWDFIELRSSKDQKMYNKLSPLKSIRAFCLECCAGQRIEVRKCPAQNCPLHSLRFGRRPKRYSISVLKSIRQKCLDCSGFVLKEVRKCTFVHCPLYPFRQGRNPHRKGIGGWKRSTKVKLCEAQLSDVE